MRASDAEILAPLAQALSASDDLLIVMDPDWRIYYLNSAFRRLLGIADEVEASTVRLIDHLHPDDRAAVQQRFILAERRAEPGCAPHLLPPMENRYRDGGGNWRRLEWHSVKVGGFYYGIARETTERVDREQRLIDAMSLARLAEFRWRIGGNTVLWTERLAGLIPLGATGSRLAVATLLQAITPSTRRGLLLAANRCRRSGVPEQAEFELVLPDGEHRFYAIRLRRQRRALLGVVQDITDRQRAQAALLSAKREAEQASAAKSAFLATMTHELRTPLNAILGYSEVMRDALLGDIPPRYADYAKSIHEAGTHLLSLINDVLDMARLEAGRHPLQLSATDLDLIAREALTYVAPSVLTANITLGIESPGSMPITVDRRAVRQVLINLLANAVKFTPSGGSVTISITRIDGGAAVEVVDTGIGIAPERLARLGRPFEQAHEQGPDVAHTGSGLGLAISRALIEQHGGSLTVSSTQGVGTRVRVILPDES